MTSFVTEGCFIFAYQPPECCVGRVAFDVRRSEITMLDVTRSMRGQGIGTQLLRRAENALQDSGCRHVCVYVGRTSPIDPPAYDFYLKNGYRFVTTHGMMKDLPALQPSSRTPAPASTRVVFLCSALSVCCVCTIFSCLCL